MSSDNYLRPLVAELERHGVTDYSIVPGGKHRSMKFRFDDREIRFVFPSSPSDWRGLQNSLSDLRRMMGVHRIIHKAATGRGHRRRGEPESVPMPTTFTVRPDPFQVLARLLEDGEVSDTERLSEVANAPTADQEVGAVAGGKGATQKLRTPWLGRRCRWQRS